MPALITGASGQLGSDLRAQLGDDARAFTRAELDITDVAAVERALEEVQPDVVFNCAAFHNVDQCEREPEPSWRVNVDAVRELAMRSPRLVHISTNYVFDGRREEAYAEFDLPAPRSVYALTKLAGEYAALAYAPRALVVRTGGLYGVHGSVSKSGNFVLRMLTRAREQGALKVVADQRLQPTYTAHLAAAILEAVARDATGVVHLTASGEASWHDFTCAIMENAGFEIPVEPVTTTIAPGGVDRPLNGVLGRPRADQLRLTPLPHWRAALDEYMHDAGLSHDGR